jgi:hypothetical protein
MKPASTTPTPEASPRVPPLRNGDHLNAEEFERRYDAMPGLKKAELINGVVYVPPDADFENYGGPRFDLIGWLGVYQAWTPGVRGADNTTLRLPFDNRPQPDGCLIIEPSHGGQVSIQDGYISGGPELVAEVAGIEDIIRFHKKLDLYSRNGVCEYIVWQAFCEQLNWFVFVRRRGKFRILPLGDDGIYRSEVLPGLWLDPVALMNRDLLRVFEVVQQGVATPEHAEFVARLQANAASTGD